jgi:hypothetical protein
MAYLLPARAASASRWTSSVLAMRWDFRRTLAMTSARAGPFRVAFGSRG